MHTKHGLYSAWVPPSFSLIILTFEIVSAVMVLTCIVSRFFKDFF